MKVKFQAKPNLNNSVNLKTFDTEEEAVSYLNKITGFPMQAMDWKMLGKLQKL
tara:strand:+ start:38 stop:196 length:159 start_codon:yes stop_codon:yes gene_type:complete